MTNPAAGDWCYDMSKAPRDKPVLLKYTPTQLYPHRYTVYFEHPGPWDKAEPFVAWAPINAPKEGGRI